MTIHKDDERIINDWFKDHIIIEHDLYAYVRNRFKIETLIWGKLNTGIYRIYYIMRHGALMVYGDLGEATYLWYGFGGDSVNLEWISTLDLHYFHSKCQASEEGRAINWYEWDEKKAGKYIFDHFKNTDKDGCRKYKQFKESYLSEALHSKEEFHAELYRNESEVDEIFGSDWWEWLPGVGNIIPLRCRAHLLGLKMAFGKTKRDDGFIQ